MMNRNVTDFLSGLGLTDEEAKIYLTLSQKGILTALELSRATNINRTRVYRLLEKLKKVGIIEEVIDEHRKLAKAADLDVIELMVRDREMKAKELRENFPTILNLLHGERVISQPGTKVLFYRGKEGIRRQIWNTLRAQREVVGYTYRSVKELIGEYYQAWKDEFVRRKLFFRDIYSDDYLESIKNDPKESIILPRKSNTSRYVPSSILDINHQIDIYNEVTSFYNWHEGEVFGVEIYNQKVADMQKQLFEIVWKMVK